MVAAFSLDIFVFLSLPCTFEVSSSLELPGRLSRARRSSLYWYMSDPRRMTFSDQHPWILICFTIYYGAFLRAFFSLDILLLKNETLSLAQRLKFWPPQLLIVFKLYIYIYIIILCVLLYIFKCIHIYKISRQVALTSKIAKLVKNSKSWMQRFDFTTKKESISKDHMPSQKFKYRRKRLLARAYGPRSRRICTCH